MTPHVPDIIAKPAVAHRASPDETFLAFTRRHEIDALKGMFAAEAVE